MGHKFGYSVLILLLCGSLGFNLLQHKIRNDVPTIEKIQVIERVQTIERVIIAEIHQRGIASWYGEPEHGRTMANGDVFDMHEITCAHPDLPFGTNLLVTNLKNGKSLRVTVTDRLPKVWVRHGRVVDMSYASAIALSMVRDGLVPVEIMILKNL